MTKSWECGGAMESRYDATVVCGPDGHALAPITQLEKGHLANKRHAQFEGDQLVTLRVSGTEKIGLTRFSIYLHGHEGNTATLLDLKWRAGNEYSIHDLMGFLPRQLMKFKDATFALIEKAGCYHCRHMHYGNEMILNSPQPGEIKLVDFRVPLLKGLDLKGIFRPNEDGFWIPLLQNDLPGKLSYQQVADKLHLEYPIPDPPENHEALVIGEARVFVSGDGLLVSVSPAHWEVQ